MMFPIPKTRPVILAHLSNARTNIANYLLGSKMHFVIISQLNVKLQNYAIS